MWTLHPRLGFKTRPGFLASSPAQLLPEMEPCTYHGYSALSSFLPFLWPIFIFCALVFYLRVYLCVFGVSWNWSYRQLWIAMSVLGIEPGSSGRTISTLDCWAISPIYGLSFFSCKELPGFAVLIINKQCRCFSISGKCSGLRASANESPCCVNSGKYLIFMPIVSYGKHINNGFYLMG